MNYVALKLFPKETFEIKQFVFSRYFEWGTLPRLYWSG